MTAYVNEKCIACGLCVSICPEVFEMTEGNVALASGEVLPELETTVQEAADNCPVSAIEV